MWKETMSVGNEQIDNVQNSSNHSILRVNSTVLTNLQRGNIKTQQNTSHLLERTIYELAAQGDLTPNNIQNYLHKIDEPDSNGLTALAWSASYGQLNTCKMLLKHGANPSHRGLHGETALMFASSNGHVHIVKLLILYGVDVNEVDEDGNTAIIYASFNNHELCVQELLISKADLTIQNKLNFDTAYSLAVKNKSQQSKVLIEKHILANLF